MPRMPTRAARPAHVDERLGDAPIEQKYREQMNELAGLLDGILNDGATGDARKVGFCLLLFEFGNDPNGRCNYISNARRDDVVILLKEQLARFEGQPEVTGRG